MTFLSLTFSPLNSKNPNKFKGILLFVKFNRRDFVLFKNFDELRNDFDGEVSTEAITNFINAHSIPTVMPFNDKAIETVF